MLEQVSATRYVAPLREGGSLPGLMEADDLGTYVVKYRGAGQGPRALVAEVIAAGLARALDLPVPRLVAVDLDPALAAGEPDQEIQDLLRASPGLNLGVDYLPGALDFDPVAFPVDPGLAGRVLWFDALIGNVDRTSRNPNLLHWHGLRLIDHGASLTFHHRWSDAASHDARPYDATDHALLRCDPDVVAADEAADGRLDDAAIARAVADVPPAWLSLDPAFGTSDEARAAYVDRIRARVAARDQWVPALVTTLRDLQPAVSR